MDTRGRTCRRLLLGAADVLRTVADTEAKCRREPRVLGSSGAGPWVRVCPWQGLGDWLAGGAPQELREPLHTEIGVVAPGPGTRRFLRWDALHTQRWARLFGGSRLSPPDARSSRGSRRPLSLLGDTGRAHGAHGAGPAARPREPLSRGGPWPAAPARGAPRAWPSLQAAAVLARAQGHCREEPRLGSRLSSAQANRNGGTAASQSTAASSRMRGSALGVRGRPQLPRVCRRRDQLPPPARSAARPASQGGCVHSQM